MLLFTRYSVEVCMILTFRLAKIKCTYANRKPTCVMRLPMLAIVMFALSVTVWEIMMIKVANWSQFESFAFNKY